MKKTLLTLAAGLVLAGKLFAHDITLVWSPSPDAGVTGYKIVYSQVGQTLTNVWRVGLTNMTTITNLVSSPAINYRFTAIATNATGLESVPTMEIVSVIPPHAVKYPRFVGRTPNGFTLTWVPSDEADAASYKVTYGIVGTLTNQTVTVPAAVTSVVITNGLVANAEYYFDFTVINTPGVESWPKYQLRDKVLPAGPADLKVSVLIQ
jgi:hypothetical protein